MPNKIKPKRSYTASSVPLAGDLETHELAIRWDANSPAMFTKDAAGQIVTVTLGGGGGSGDGADATLRALFVPPAPTGLTATAGNAQASLSWTAPTGVIAQAPVSDYVVQFSSNSGSSWSTFSDGTSTLTSATVTGLTNSTAHVFRVAAVNAVGVGAYSTASSAVTPTAGDPLFSSVQLLLRGDTSIADASAYSRSVTASGGAAVSTAQKKFGAGSIAFNGGAGTVVPAANAGYNLGSGDWVIEGWVYFNSVASDQRVGGGDLPFSIGGYNWAWYTTTSGRLDYYLSSSGSSWNLASGSQFGTIVANQWYHVALVRNGSTVTPYLNGTAGTTASVGSSSIFNNTSNGPFIGAQGTSYFNGFVDDFRVTVGNSRGYTGSTITVPTAAFPDVGPISAPTSLTATGGNAQVSLAWTAPSYNGGSAITDYSVQFSSNSGATWTTFSRTASTTASQVVTGLTNGTSYVFRVAGINANGTGDYTAASGSVTPVGTLLAISGSDAGNWTGTGTSASKFTRASAISRSGCSEVFPFVFEALANSTFRASGSTTDDSGDGDDSMQIQIWNSALSSVVSTLFDGKGSFNVTASISAGQKVRWRKSCNSSGNHSLNGGVTVWAE